MTIATTATTEYNVDELIETAFWLDGLLNPGHPLSSGDKALGRRVLHLGIQALANTGIKLRTRERLTLVLTDGTNYVDCPTDTISVEQGGFVRNSDGTSDIPIQAITLQRYQAFTDKTISGMPAFYYPEQQSNGSWKIYFYPVPDSEWPTFIVPRVRRARDVSTGDVTVDFDQKWYLTIVKFLQGNIARSKGRRDLATELMIEYDLERERAENNETERGDGMFVATSTPWDDF